MKNRIRLVATLLVAALLLSGCSMLTADQMYCLPKRSEDYNNLQTAIDSAMSDMAYCAPRSGENQQPVQMADLDGDGINEHLLFAKSGNDRPLRILVFRKVGDDYIQTNTVHCNGSTFDQVEYVDMDDKPGVEIVVGRQVSEQVTRSVSVYTMKDSELEQVITVSYTKFLPVDLDGNGISELFLIRPGNTDTDNGTAELYAMHKGNMERTNELDLSQPADKLKRIIVGKLHSGGSAVYVASTVDETALITDVYTIREGMLVNIAFSNDAATSIKTLRNYYVYAEDIDADGVVELPQLMAMKPMTNAVTGDKYHFIRWYAMTSEGAEVDKLYTFHNFVGGWYMHLGSDIAHRLTVSVDGSECAFYLWDEEYKSIQKLLTVYAYTAQNKEEQAAADGKVILHRTESTTYAASLEEASLSYGITHDSVIYGFRLIQQAWKTGET